MENYIKVSTVEDFAKKDYKCIRYLGKHIGVFKNKNNSFYALEVDCKHQNANLLIKAPRNNIATCVRHGWKYNLQTGECLTRRPRR